LRFDPDSTLAGQSYEIKTNSLKGSIEEQAGVLAAGDLTAAEPIDTSTQ
jgi:hypothetical protein